MRQPAGSSPMGALLRLLMAVVILGCTLAASQALAFIVKVVDQDGNPVRGFRWLVEEDTSRDITPGVYQPPDQTVRLSVYRSHSPSVKAGHAMGGSASITVPRGKRYFVSVLPDGGYSMAGTAVRVPGTKKVTLTVHKHPLPTAQIQSRSSMTLGPSTTPPTPKRPVSRASTSRSTTSWARCTSTPSGIPWGLHTRETRSQVSMYWTETGTPLWTRWETAFTPTPTGKP